MVSTWICDHSSIEVDAVVNNTVKISRVEKQGPQKILMGPKIKYMSIYSEKSLELGRAKG